MEKRSGNRKEIEKKTRIAFSWIFLLWSSWPTTNTAIASEQWTKNPFPCAKLKTGLIRTPNHQEIKPLKEK